MMSGCQGRDKTPTMKEKECPRCGNLIEIFSIETEAVCDKCGFTIYNDTADCVEWCKYAKLCVGPAQYAATMEAVERRNAQKKAAE